jgi:dephospho-CoA kinase
MIDNPVICSLSRDSVFPVFSSISPLSSESTSRSCLALVPLVGIVGGVGAGKSSVVRNVKSLQLHFIDADRIGHEQLALKEIKDKIVKTFGTEVLDSVGEISRPKLAAQVFGDSTDKHGKRQHLNAIVHPAIRSEIRRQINSAPQDVDAIILDAALLLEAGWADECNAVIFIDTSLEQRRKRVAETRGWSAEELQRREASQLSLEEKRQRSDFCVDNSGEISVAAQQMEQALRKIIADAVSLNRQE